MLRKRKAEKIEDPVQEDLEEELPPEPKPFPRYPGSQAPPRRLPPARRAPAYPARQAPRFSAIERADELFEDCFSQSDPEWEIEQVMLRLNYNIRRSIK